MVLLGQLMACTSQCEGVVDVARQLRRKGHTQPVSIKEAVT